MVKQRIYIPCATDNWPMWVRLPPEAPIKAPVDKLVKSALSKGVPQVSRFESEQGYQFFRISTDMIQTIFGSPVVILKGNNVDQLLPPEVKEDIIRCLMHSDNKFIEHPFTRGGKICTTDLNSEMGLDKIAGLDILFEFLKSTALQYVDLYSDKAVKDLKFCTAWVNLMFRGCEIRNHNDRYYNSERSLIVTFYPKVPKGGSNLVFIYNGKDGDWVSDCLEKDLLRIQIEDGDIVIFDNSIFHAVDVHNSDIPRMCIATEFSIQN